MMQHIPHIHTNCVMLQVAKGSELSNEIFLIVAATIYYHEDNYEAALKYV